MDSWLRIKIGDADEFDANSITTNLQFLELTTTPQFANTYQNISGVDGSIYTTAQFNKTTVNLKFVLYFRDWTDFDLAKHDIYRTFLTKEIIRVRCDTAPNKVYYCRSNQFDIQIKKVGDLGVVFTVPLDNPSGMAYSICNSDEIADIEHSNNWSYGMNIPNNYPLQYHFKDTNNFSIYNPSDIRINPYLDSNELSIKVKFTGDNISLKNSTNGSNWQYNKKGNGTDTILLNGINSSLNGNPCSKDTNFGHIELEKGVNNIVVSGTNSLDVVFSFPFVYLA